ncbi:MAG: hypothetical protein OHK0045_18230 [Raineya sp.]
MKNIVILAGVAVMFYACNRPEYPTPQVNQASVAPLARTNANNARLMVFNALVNFAPDPNNDANAFFSVSVDGQELPNLNGTRGIMYSSNFTLDAGNNIVVLNRKYPAAANFTGLAGAAEQSSSYTGLAFTGTPPSGFSTATAFTNFAQSVPASIINGVEVTPARQEVGVFVPAGRRNVIFNNVLNEPNNNLRVNANFGAGSNTSIFLRGVLGTTSGATAEGATVVTEATLPSPGGSTAIRFLNFASDLGDVQLLTANASNPFGVDRRPMLAFPNPPSNTRFTSGNAAAVVAQRDSLASRSRYVATSSQAILSRSYSSNTFPVIAIERSSDGQPIPNYSFSVPVTSFSTRTAGTYTFNFYFPNRSHTTPVLSKNVTFNFTAGGVFTIILHGSATKGYKCDIVRMN